MKGVSEIIAIVLILMIVIALAALAWTWFSGTMSTMLGTATTSVTTTTNAMATSFIIETAKNLSSAGVAGNITVVIRNTGTQAINLSLMQAYVGGIPYSFVPTIGSSNALGVGGAIPEYVSIPAPYTGSICNQVLTLTIGTGMSSTKTIVC